MKVKYLAFDHHDNQIQICISNMVIVSNAMKTLFGWPTRMQLVTAAFS